MDSLVLALLTLSIIFWFVDVNINTVSAQYYDDDDDDDGDDADDEDEDEQPFNMVNPAHFDLRWAGLWMAAHKYFEVDRRKGNELSWKYAPRVYHKHFPLPRLKRLHPRAVAACDEGVVACVRDIASLAKESSSLYKLLNGNSDSGEEEELPPESYPFDTPLELFRYRTTVSYYMCLFTMQRSEFLMNYMDGANCLVKLDQVQEKFWADMEVIDYRYDSYMEPFLCAQIQFCPDPCYGKKSEGSVSTQRAMKNDQGNPCRRLKDRRCKWDVDNNLDFNSLQRNRFNISCNCAGEKAGFEWNSRFALCVDKDECEDDDMKCEAGRVCQNLVGTYTCMCSRGHIYNKTRDVCVQQIPLPPHSRTKPLKIKPHRQKTALRKMLEYLLGLQNSTKQHNK